jgi:ABC-2 type transport system ATP-binding protein
MSFELPAGQVIGVLGPNGAGKTTLLKMLVGLVRPTSGHAELLGCRTDHPGFVDVLRRIGAIIEAPSLYLELTVRQNLELQALSMRVVVDRARRTEVLEMVDLADRADDRARTLSLGMKQRLGIAVALVARPELVILDEPANGLDPAGIVEIRQLLRRLAREGTSVIVSSHQLAETQQACDRLLVLNQGGLAATGTIDEILSDFPSNRFSIRLDPGDIVTASMCLAQRGITFELDASLIHALAPAHCTGRDLNRALTECNVHAIEVRHNVATLEEAFLLMTTNKSTLNRSRHVAS